MESTEVTLTTRERLLDVAGQAFADLGFRDTTIREICTRAGANVAAINYHFGDKERLYAAVLEHTHRCSLEKHPIGEGINPAAPAEERLHAFIRSFVHKLFDSGRPNWHIKLISREMIEPTGALDAIVEGTIRPQFVLLSSIVRDLMQPPVSERNVELAGASVIGQCLHYHHCRAVTDRLLPGRMNKEGVLDEIIDHVYRFSLAGVRALGPGGRIP